MQNEFENILRKRGITYNRIGMQFLSEIVESEMALKSGLGGSIDHLVLDLRVYTHQRNKPLEN